MLYFTCYDFYLQKYNIINKTIFKLHVLFSGLKVVIRLLFSRISNVLIQCPSDCLFSCRENRKNIFYTTYPLHFTRTQTSRYITGFIYVAEPKWYTVAWAGKISALSRLNPSLLWHAAKNVRLVALRVSHVMPRVVLFFNGINTH